MSDTLTSEFNTRVTSTMESILRRAVFEIMKIFESSLHGHQMELVQRGEEIAHLKIQLRRTVLKLRECEGDTGAAINTSQMSEPSKEPEEVISAPGQTSEVPEIDFEVPDDWCAPLGCEPVAKPVDDACPSIRLRKLYIPLKHIQLVNHKVNNTESQLQTKGGRTTRSGSLQERGKQTQDGSFPVPTQRKRQPPQRNDMRILLLENLKEHIEQTDSHIRRGRSQTGEEQENKVKRKSSDIKVEATESKPTKEHTVENDGEKKYNCKFCSKEFETRLGQIMHMRIHKRCRGCKKEFPFPSALNSHKPTCAKLKKLLMKETNTSQNPQSSGQASPSETQKISKKESAPSSSSCSESSVLKHDPLKKHHCTYCGKTFTMQYRLTEHVRLHTGEKPFSCNACPKKFHVLQSLKIHMGQKHRGNNGGTKAGPSWNVRLKTENDQEDKSQAVNHSKVQREEEQGAKWQTMGTKGPAGYTCLLCNKVKKNKLLMIEHFRTHTGEKPLKCDSCPATFPTHSELGVHRKGCAKRIFQCDKCQKFFTSQMRHDKHVKAFHRNWQHFCKVCGRGFLLEGRLRNHMESHE